MELSFRLPISPCEVLSKAEIAVECDGKRVEFEGLV